MTTLAEIRSYLQANKNERGIERWKKNGNSSWGSYGIAPTKLKKIAKNITNSRTLALQLRQQPNYELKVIALLIDNPLEIPLEETKRMVTQMHFWPIKKLYIQHVFSKLPYAMELATVYRNSSKTIERRCGYEYIRYAVKNKKIPDAYFIPIINSIENRWPTEKHTVKEVMDTVLYSIGKRSKTLSERCFISATNINAIPDTNNGGAKSTPLKTAQLLEKKHF